MQLPSALTAAGSGAAGSGAGPGVPPRAGGPCPRPAGCGGGEGAALGPAAPPVSLRPRASPGSISERPGREVGREPARRGGRGGQGRARRLGPAGGWGRAASPRAAVGREGASGFVRGPRLLPPFPRRTDGHPRVSRHGSERAARLKPPAGDVPAVALLSAAPRAARS